MKSDHISIWNQALKQISKRISSQNYNMWINPIECLDIDSVKHVIHLKTPDDYIRFWFESNFLKNVLDLIKEETGDLYTVIFKEKKIETQSSETLSEISDEPQAIKSVSQSHSLTKTATGLNHNKKDLNKNYTFERFIVGQSNQLAHAASKAAAIPEKPKYNPLFICGDVGLGKTHLLHAIGHQIQSCSDLNVIYMTCEQFVTDYINAIRNKTMQQFRNRIRKNCDVLLLDDIQFFAGKNQTQDEFFHVFNELHSTGKQIVLTSDKKPHEILNLTKRLQTRFSWGLIADIATPEFELRKAILKSKAQEHTLALTEDAIAYLSEKITGSVREIEGALTRIKMMASIKKQASITSSFAQNVIEDIVKPLKSNVSTKAVLEAVCDFYDISIAEIKGTRRTKAIAHPRAVAMYLARQRTEHSYPHLGKDFGGKHHTTVIASVHKIETQSKKDRNLEQDLNKINEKLSS